MIKNAVSFIVINVQNYYLFDLILLFIFIVMKPSSN